MKNVRRFLIITDRAGWRLQQESKMAQTLMLDDKQRISNGSVNFTTSSSPTQLKQVMAISYTINIALNAPLLLSGMFGNILILIALRKTSSLHAPSKALLCSLAVSDLSVAVLVQPLYLMYFVSGLNQKYALQEHIWTIFAPASYILCTVSLATTTAITVDRLLAVHLKARYREVVTLRRVTLTVIAVWILSGVFTVTKLNLFMSYIITSCGIGLSLGISFLSYLTIYRILRRQNTQVHHLLVIPNFHKTAPAAHAINAAHYKKSVINSLYIYCALLLCYLPWMALIISWSVTGGSTAELVAYDFARTLIYVNSTLNPLLYCWRVKELRRAAMNSLKKLSPC